MEENNLNQNNQENITPVAPVIPTAQVQTNTQNQVPLTQQVTPKKSKTPLIIFGLVTVIAVVLVATLWK